jgi:hypothetical protein
VVVLTQQHRVTTAEQVKTGIEYRIDLGRLNYFGWRSQWAPIIWSQSRGATLEEQLEAYTSFNGPWDFEISEAQLILPQIFAQSDRYRLVRIATTTLVYRNEEYLIEWRTGKWEKVLSNFAAKVGITTGWRAHYESQIMTEDKAHLEKWQVETEIQIHTFFPTETREVNCYPGQKERLLETITRTVGDLSFYTTQVGDHDLQAEDIKAGAEVRVTPKPWLTV